MSLVAELFRDPEIINALAAEPGAQGNVPQNVIDEIARERGKLLRIRAAEARTIIVNYNEGGSRHSTLLKLRKLMGWMAPSRHLSAKMVVVEDHQRTGAIHERDYNDWAGSGQEHFSGPWRR